MFLYLSIASDTMFAEIKEVPSLSNILAAGEPTQKVLINERSLGYGQALVQGCSMYVHNSIRCNFGADASVQSRFSINLENTGLAVAPESHWHRLGPEQFTQRNIKRSKVSPEHSSPTCTFFYCITFSRAAKK